MKKMVLFISFSVFMVMALGFFWFKDYLPPRTPVKVARIQSNLKIPNEVHVIDFKEEYSFNGEGYIYILLRLNNKNLKEITEECIRAKYKKLTIENLISDKFIQPNTKYGIKLYDKDITLIKEGYYKLNAIDISKLHFGITVVDVLNSELIIYVRIP